MRAIGEPVKPPMRKARPPSKVYHSGLKKSDIMAKVLRRILWVIVITFLLFLIVPTIFFSPIIIASLVLSTSSWDILNLPLFFSMLVVPILLIVVPISFFLAYWIVASSISQNRVEVRKNHILIKVMMSTRSPPRQLRVPLRNIDKVKKPGQSYISSRKKETRFYHRMGNHFFKPRPGDYYNLFTDPNNLLILEMERPISVPYVDYVWTGGERYDRPRRTREVVIDIDPEIHDEFIEEIEKRSRAIKWGDFP